MLLTHLRSLRDHGEWADAHLLSAVAGASVPVPAAIRELAHIRGAQETWLARIEQRGATLPVWPDLTIAELARAGSEVDAAMRARFEGLRDAALNDVVAYANSTGTHFTTPLGEILLHLLLHGQYHRGKVNAALRAAGAQPVGIDYIAWQRAHRAAADSPNIRQPGVTL